jgi:hypothetical protein
MRTMAERAALRKDAVRLLDDLGGSASAVAASLSWFGVQDQHSSAIDTPLTRYLHAVVGADFRVRRIKITRGWLALKTHRRSRATIWLRLPHPVREFTVSVHRVRSRRASLIP